MFVPESNNTTRKTWGDKKEVDGEVMFNENINAPMSNQVCFFHQEIEQNAFCSTKSTFTGKHFKEPIIMHILFQKRWLNTIRFHR